LSRKILKIVVNELPPGLMPNFASVMLFELEQIENRRFDGVLSETPE
jgi:hypothetical protein